MTIERRKGDLVSKNGYRTVGDLVSDSVLIIVCDRCEKQIGGGAAFFVGLQWAQIESRQPCCTEQSTQPRPYGVQ